MTAERLQRQLDFLREADKVKQVRRQTLVSGDGRRENDAEHMWHLALMACLLVEHAADESVDLLRVIRMALIHDLVEIDAGDTFCYDDAGQADRVERERRAAERVFGLLPPDQARELRNLWEEFEARQTPDARFAAALDRLQPMLQNVYTRGAAWQRHGITRAQVLDRNRHIADGSPALWQCAMEAVEEAVRQGWLDEGDTGD